MNRDLLYIIAPYIRKSLIFRLLQVIDNMDIPYFYAFRKLHDSHLSHINGRIICDNISRLIPTKSANNETIFYYRYNNVMINISRVFNSLYIINRDLSLSCNSGYVLNSVANGDITINYDNNRIIINTRTQYIICDAKLSRVVNYYMKNSNGNIMYI